MRNVAMKYLTVIVKGEVVRLDMEQFIRDGTVVNLAQMQEITGDLAKLSPCSIRITQG